MHPANDSPRRPVASLSLCLSLVPGVIHPSIPDLTAEAELLDVAARHGCRFDGYAWTPDCLCFTDLRPGSPAYGGTLAVRLDAIPADLRREIFAQREAFAGTPDAGFFEAADRA